MSGEGERWLQKKREKGARGRKGVDGGGGVGEGGGGGCDGRKDRKGESEELGCIARSLSYGVSLLGLAA